MALAVRTGAWSPSGAPLPYLRRVAYLESHGTEWIDTGIIPPLESFLNYFCLCDFALTRTDINNPIFSCRSKISGGSSYNLWAIGGDRIRFDWKSGVNYAIKPTIGVIYSFTVNAYGYHKWTLNDIQYPLNEGGRAIRPSSMLLFSTRNGTDLASVFSWARIYSFKYQDEFRNQILDLIPVLDLSGRPCFYDEVSAKLFYNQGEGEFTWGELDEASNAPSQLGGGYNRKCVRRSYRRSARPSARFYAHSHRWEVAA